MNVWNVELQYPSSVILLFVGGGVQIKFKSNCGCRFMNQFVVVQFSSAAIPTNKTILPQPIRPLLLF